MAAVPANNSAARLPALIAVVPFIVPSQWVFDML